MIVTDAQHKAVVNVSENDVLEDLEVERPEVFPGLSSVVGDVQEVESNVVVIESFR